jgi:hypothetical protein
MTTSQLCDEVWLSLRGNLFRRTILGRKRCDELVMLSCAEFPDRELSACVQGSEQEREQIDRMIDRVSSRYQQIRSASPGKQEYGFAFLTLVLVWAVSAIVQYLVIKWWKKHFDAAEMRRQYGWKR